MNKRQKEVLQASLTDEQAVLDALERNYTAALADVKRSIKALQANPLTQSRAYQLEYQQALERQISGALDVLQSQNFTTVAEYLQAAYTTSFVGSMYDMHGQGVPLLLPIDEATVLATVQKTGDDFKLSRKLGGDTDLLKRQVQDEITRGLASGSSYAKIARSITDYGEADYKRSARIARTEGHRVQNEARMHSMERAKKAGADVVKQWDATLDDTTRESHAKADGEIREMDEPFSNGLMFPGDPSGKAAEVVNCRCAMLVRARWALDEGELRTLQERAEFFGLDKTENFEDFKEKYLKSVVKSDTLKTTDPAAINVVASNGLKVTRLSYHAFQQSKDPTRTVTMDDIKDAVINPIHIGDVITDKEGRRSQRFIGNVATVNVNPDTGVVATVWRTGTATRKKYTKAGE